MPTTRPPLDRWVLLLAVIAGVFGMHVLTAGDGPGHGMVPVPVMTDQHTTHDSSAIAVEAGPTTADTLASSPAPTGHGDMAGCILFLIVGGAALLLVAVAHGTNEHGDAAATARRLLLDLRRRGPPDGWPRLALGVIRV